MDSFYSDEELKLLGLRNLGKGVKISRYCSIYGAEKISLGDYVRIDDFCILSGKICMGNYIHIAAYTGLYGGEKGIEIRDYSTISSHSSVYAVSDDYSGSSMTNPMIQNDFRNITEGNVILDKHVIIGSHSVILPGCNIQEGVAVGAMSLVTKNLEEWGVYVGIPCRRLKDRKKDLLELERQFLEMK